MNYERKYQLVRNNIGATILKELNRMKIEARDYAEIYGQEYLYACAAVFNSHIAKFTLNTFMILKTLLIPLRGFTQKQDAVNWLNEIKKKKEQL